MFGDIFVSTNKQKRVLPAALKLISDGPLVAVGTGGQLTSPARS